MSKKLLDSRLSNGVWEGLVAGTPEGAAPQLDVLHQGEVLPGLEVSAVAGDAGHWLLRQPLPMERLSEGVQVFLLRDHATGLDLGSFTLIAGAPPLGDLRAELTELRAELDLLKQAFRRHCAET